MRVLSQFQVAQHFAQPLKAQGSELLGRVGSWLERGMALCAE